MTTAPCANCGTAVDAGVIIESESPSSAPPAPAAEAAGEAAAEAASA